jgi:hypothetical protein
VALIKRIPYTNKNDSYAITSLVQTCKCKYVAPLLLQLHFSKESLQYALSLSFLMDIIENGLFTYKNCTRILYFKHRHTVFRKNKNEHEKLSPPK